MMILFISSYRKSPWGQWHQARFRTSSRPCWTAFGWPRGQRRQPKQGERQRQQTSWWCWWLRFTIENKKLRRENNDAVLWMWKKTHWLPASKKGVLECLLGAWLVRRYLSKQRTLKFADMLWMLSRWRWEQILWYLSHQFPYKNAWSLFRRGFAPVHCCIRDSWLKPKKIGKFCSHFLSFFSPRQHYFLYYVKIFK